MRAQISHMYYVDRAKTFCEIFENCQNSRNCQKYTAGNNENITKSPHFPPLFLYFLPGTFPNVPKFEIEVAADLRAAGRRFADSVARSASSAEYRTNRPEVGCYRFVRTCRRAGQAPGLTGDCHYSIISVLNSLIICFAYCFYFDPVLPKSFGSFQNNNQKLTK